MLVSLAMLQAAFLNSCHLFVRYIVCQRDKCCFLFGTFGTLSDLIPFHRYRFLTIFVITLGIIFLDWSSYLWGFLFLFWACSFYSLRMFFHFFQMKVRFLIKKKRKLNVVFLTNYFPPGQLEACAHPFFDELREPNARLPNGRQLPPLFNFKQEVCLQTLYFIYVSFPTTSQLKQIRYYAIHMIQLHLSNTSHQVKDKDNLIAYNLCTK